MNVNSPHAFGKNGVSYYYDSNQPLLFEGEYLDMWLTGRRILIFIAICTLFTAASFCQDKNPLATAMPGYYLISSWKGNFTNSGFAEFVAFYGKENSFDSSVYRVAVDVVQNNHIMKMYQVEFFDIDVGGKKYFLDGGFPLDNPSLIFVQNSTFGPWNGFCEIADSNGNGLDEFLFFRATGYSFHPYIFEFHEGKIKQILTPSVLVSERTEKIERKQENGNYVITVWGHGNEKNLNEVDWYKYFWSSASNTYVFNSKGIDKNFVLKPLKK